MAAPARIATPRGMLLENGARMSRFEFHRRYEASDVERAELIEGVVYVSSPLRMHQHGTPDAHLGAWMGVYVAGHADIEFGHNGSLVLDADNEVQPDIILWRIGGGAYENAHGYLEGAPELIAEVAASSMSVDLHGKKNAYRRNGVREYIVWRTLDEQLDWFVLEEGEYVRLEPDADGIIESREFPGLRLHVEKLLAGDLARVLAEIR
ncbi:MAG: Uma2 family endonuclease [Dehalococcoidia bacterium]